ncbi:MAG: methionyl-tRNA formyltransferase [Candidatus Hydrogenedentota bacterium]
MKEKLDIVFFGLPDLGVEVLSGIIELKDLVDVKWLVSPGPRDENNDPLILLAKKENIPYYILNNIKDIYLKERLIELRPFVVIVAGFDFKILPELLVLPSFGFINIHPSLLPEYRGGNPYFWVIANGEKETGVTFHKMDENFDTGPILYQEKIEIHQRESLGTLLFRLGILAKEMVKKLIVDLFVKRKELEFTIQDKECTKFAPKLKDKDLILDFNKDAAVVDRLTRAASPYYGMVTKLNGLLNVKVWETAPLFENEDAKSKIPMELKPGTIKLIDNKVVIICSTSCVELKVIQIENIFLGSGYRAYELGLIRDGDCFRL